MAPQSLQDFLIAWTSLNLNKGLPVDPDNTLSKYGIDSLKALILVEDTQNMFGFEWPPYLFFEDLSIAQLATEGMKLMEES
jgi:acyl carrier protein